MHMSVDQKQEKRRTACAGSANELPSGGWRDKVTMAFALGTGLRAGERVNLAFVDLRLNGATPVVIVRVGS
jgi:hypothetical protein